MAFLSNKSGTFTEHTAYIYPGRDPLIIALIVHGPYYPSIRDQSQPLALKERRVQFLYLPILE